MKKSWSRRLGKRVDVGHPEKANVGHLEKSNKAPGVHSKVQTPGDIQSVPGGYG